MFSDISGLALHQWKTMFIKISTTFVYAMDMKLKLKSYSTCTGPKGNGKQNLGHMDDWCQV